MEFPQKELQRYTKILTTVEKKLTGQPWNILVVISRVTLLKKSRVTEEDWDWGNLEFWTNQTLYRKGM
jgi:hypothetical protein